MRFLCHLSAVHGVAYRGLHNRRVWLLLEDVHIENFHDGYELPPGAIAGELVASVVLTAETCLLKLWRQREPGAGILRENLLDVELVPANIARHRWRYQIIQG